MKKEDLTKLAELQDKMIKLGREYNELARKMNAESQIGVIHSQYDEHGAYNSPFPTDPERVKKAEKKKFIGDRVDYLGKDSCTHYINAKNQALGFPQQQGVR